MPKIIWIASYPRSGNTWMRFALRSYLMAGQSVAQSAGEDAFETIEDVIPDFHLIARSGDTLRLNGSTPVILKTHYLPSADDMRAYRDVPGKALYLVRNPRDVMLSVARYTGVSPSVEMRARARARAWARRFLSNYGYPNWPYAIGSWPQNVAEWTDPVITRRLLPGIEPLIMRYEDLRSDPVRLFQRIVEFLELGIQVDPDRVRRAVESSSIERMRAQEDEALQLAGTGRPLAPDPVRRFVGQGLHGQSLAVLGEEIETEYQRLLQGDNEFSRCAKRFGYES